MKILSHLLTILGQKGKIATGLGLVFAGPINLKVVIDFCRDITYSTERLYQVIAYNAIAYAWFILFSMIKVKFGQLEIEVKD